MDTEDAANVPWLDSGGDFLEVWLSDVRQLRESLEKTQAHEQRVVRIGHFADQPYEEMRRDMGGVYE